MKAPILIKHNQLGEVRTIMEADNTSKRTRNNDEAKKVSEIMRKIRLFQKAPNPDNGEKE